ncbi:MAG: GAF domain-containing protein [Pleurocapsa minor GSE-CHR-MK-17-07R]|jgi:signal transduction histidine kinase|nr:GAF domain-containing protein [Pleurocapsa minor GSE-CHR-MK 17-07R]
MGAITSTTAANDAIADRAIPSARRTFTFENRLGVLLSLTALILSAAAAIIYLSSALAWRQHPVFFGAMLSRTLVVDGSLPAGETPWRGLTAGLMRNDRIVGLNGAALSREGDYETALRSFNTLLDTLSPNASLEVAFLRDSDAARLTPEACAPVTSSPDRCEVTYRVGTFPEADFVASFVAPFVSGVVVWGIALVVFIMRRNHPGPRAVVFSLTALSVFMTGLFDLNTTYRLVPLWIFASSLIGGAIGSLPFVLPVRSALAYRQPALRFLPMLLSIIAAAALISIHADPADPFVPLAAQNAAAAVAVVGLLILVAGMVIRRSNTAVPLQRDQINTVLIGVSLTLAIGVIWLLNIIVRAITGADLLPLNTSAVSPLFTILAFSLGLSVLQYRAVNTDRIVTQGVTYLIMLVALVGGYFLLVYGASLVVGNVVEANNPVLVAVIIFVMAVLFVPVRARIQERVDRLFFRRRTDFQQKVEAFSRTLAMTGDTAMVVSTFRDALDDGIQPTQAFVFLPTSETNEYVAEGTDIRFSKESPIVSELASGASPIIYLEAGQPWPPALLVERARLHILKAMIIAGFRSGGDVNGFAMIGVPKSGEKGYTFEEMRFVENLHAQMSVSIERAQVVASLERRVRELDVLSQVSQAVGFTLEFDDLLELISAQADKLIEASQFYIVLRDPETNLLRYAFFLENDERDIGKENVRWAMGRDLYSDVIRTGQPMRVAHYARETTQRALDQVYETPDLRAWMCVPLNASGQRLGAMAVGMLEAGKQYSDEQLKVFNDIASLAATSLERSRLFDETARRARQLSVLNDISRQLVASEVNLEGLLKLITDSATEILTAEAGSLLLTAEDGTGDLIFRVAVGGSGDSIIGVRVPAGRGLVGEVASTASPVIVPDVANDPRWAGDLGKGPFTTRSVIAVPLVSGNAVIGVLEVLNKAEGTFTQEDADLLNTFAGQAAVAIENARLFEMTDQQLSMRVSELETMERIDVELNRSLDLAKVARITVEWAVENSPARAAMLGVVTGDPAMLEIVYSMGYEVDDLPQGTVGRLLPLDKGIVSRVMRTRQPELVTDVQMDRDYVPSLRGGLSQITIPMLSGGNVNAMLILETNTEPRMRLADLPFLQRLAEHASIAIVNAQLYTELDRANSSKSEFVSFVAHELKNPLTSIRGYSEFLLGPQMGALSDMQKNFVTTIRSNAERMNTLVSDLNDVTKLQTNNMRIDPKSVAFRRILDETVRPLQKQIEDKGQTLVLEIPEDLPPIFADEGRMIQVLTNLLSNAHKYTPENGHITIRAEVRADMRDANGKLLPPQLVASVVDTGIGMSEEDLVKLFTPYFRSDNPLAQAQPGTGLGMAITRGLIERHGGEMRVSSVLGQGTTFAFSVALAQPSPEAGGD